MKVVDFVEDIKKKGIVIQDLWIRAESTIDGVEITVCIRSDEGRLFKRMVSSSYLMEIVVIGQRDESGN